MKAVRTYFISGGLLLLTLVVALYLSVALFIGEHAASDTKIHSDVILVLGAKAYHGNSYNSCLVSRVTHAVDLYKSKYAQKILVSGGTDSEDHINEAETMKKIAMKYGISSNTILLETRSTSTYENLVFSQKILKSAHLKSIIIVTEPFHAAGAALVAEKLGLPYTISPASQSPCWFPWKYASSYFLKEPLAIILYKIENKL